jgi:hypothetical protein
MIWRRRREESDLRERPRATHEKALDAAIKIGEDAVRIRISLEIREKHTVDVLNAAYRYMMTGRNAEARVLIGRLVRALEWREPDRS